MAAIIKPLDEISEIINNLQQCSHTERRGSFNENSLKRILDKVNEAKNAIIIHIIDKPLNITESYITDTAVKSENPNFSKLQTIRDRSCNKLIIPTGNSEKPTKETSLLIERNVKNVLRSTNTYATISKVNPTNNGNIVFQFDASDNLSKISEHLKHELGNKIKVIEPMLPKMTIHNLPDTIDPSDLDSIKKNIIESNTNLRELLNNQVNKLDVLFSFDNKDSHNAVIKCSPAIRNFIINNKRRIRIDMSSCVVSDRLFIPHCTKCQSLLHTLKNCKENKFTCSFCGKDHKSTDCPSKDIKNEHSCANCSSSNNQDIKKMANTHNAFSKSCPVFRDLKNQLISKICWDGNPPTST